MRWDPPKKWTKRFAWLPTGVNCGAPNTGLGKTVWLEWIYIEYRPPHKKLVMTKEEYERWE